MPSSYSQDVSIGSAGGHAAVTARATSPCCLAVGLAVHEIVGHIAKVHEITALAERARQAFEIDAYAMSCAVMFAQVKPPAWPFRTIYPGCYSFDTGTPRLSGLTLPLSPCAAAPRPGLTPRLSRTNSPSVSLRTAAPRPGLWI